MEKEIERIKDQMLTQDNRSTAYPIFIVVEKRKIYGVTYANSDGRERIEEDWYDGELCESCEAKLEDGFTLDDDCNDCPDSAFRYYRTEEDVPNLRAGFFFTAEACDAHIQANRHHYDDTAKSYAISAYHNQELQAVMKYLCGKDLR